jgi:hypothetical protein
VAISPTVRPAREFAKAPLDLLRIAYINRGQFYVREWGHRLHRGQLSDPSGEAGIPHLAFQLDQLLLQMGRLCR